MDEKFVVVEDHSKQFLIMFDIEVDFVEIILLDEDQYYLEQIMVDEKPIVVAVVLLVF
jgi:hypothetical protein